MNTGDSPYGRRGKKGSVVNGLGSQFGPRSLVNGIFKLRLKGQVPLVAELRERKVGWPSKHRGDDRKVDGAN